MSTVADAFLDFLTLALPNIECNGNDYLKYNGPANWRTEVITRSLETIRKQRAFGTDHNNNPSGSGFLSGEDNESVEDGRIIGVLEADPMHTPIRPSQQTPSLLVSTSTPGSQYLDDLDEDKPEYIMIQVPKGPLEWTTQYSLDPVEELKWLKMQVSDIARVCQAVSRGDFTHRITIPVESVVMVQLRDVVNNMVDNVACFCTEIRSNSVRRIMDIDPSCICSNQSAPLEGAFIESVSCTRQLAATLVNLIRSVADVVTALALGDYSRRLDLPEPAGELLDLQIIVNETIKRLQERAQQ